MYVYVYAGSGAAEGSTGGQDLSREGEVRSVSFFFILLQRALQHNKSPIFSDLV